MKQAQSQGCGASSLDVCAVQGNSTASAAERMSAVDMSGLWDALELGDCSVLRDIHHVKTGECRMDIRPVRQIVSDNHAWYAAATEPRF